jgi:hypothetical protein
MLNLLFLNSYYLKINERKSFLCSIYMSKYEDCDLAYFKIILIYLNRICKYDTNFYKIPILNNFNLFKIFKNEIFKIKQQKRKKKI